jgi:perosamine synthetase
MDEIMKIAKKHNLYVIEDAAEALGSEYKGEKVGSMGDIGVFSFHGAKTCTTGEGGMLVTDNEELFRKASTLNNAGRNPESKKVFYADMIGYKYKMSNLQAALGLAQLERIEELVDRKRQIFYEYKEKLSDLLGISINPEPPHIKNSFWMPTVIFDKSLNIDRKKLIDFFKEKNVDIRPFFYPVSSFPIFEKNEKNVVSYNIYYRGINLPSYHDITSEEIEYVCNLLKEFIEKNETKNTKIDS